MTKRSAVRLTVIREPDEGKPIVIDLADDVTGITIFIDEHARNAPAMLCGDCDAVLVEGIERGTLDGIVLHCPNCGAYNATP